MVEDLPILGREDDRRLMRQLTAQYDVPAYVRRARNVQDAFEELTGGCREQRDEWLQMARIHLGTLAGLAGRWERLRPLLEDDEQVPLLEGLAEELQPRPRLPVPETTSTARLRRAVRELVEALRRFNRRWEQFLPNLDLGPVNALREGYNRYFLLEKECAIRSARVARQGYRPLEPLTHAELAELFPPLPVPRLKMP